MGESTDLGNTFWQVNFGKNRKTHLGRELVKPSTEVLISQPRFYQALDRGIAGFTNPRSRYLNTLTEVFRYLGRGLKKTDLALIQTNGKFTVPCRGVNPAIPST